jgi:hypothetical protein
MSLEEQEDLTNNLGSGRLCEFRLGFCVLLSGQLKPLTGRICSKQHLEELEKDKIRGRECN